MKLKNFIIHLFVFFLIEIAFVFVIFREFPTPTIFSLIGVLHLIFWILIIISGLLREKATKVPVRFVLTFLPIVYHFFMHLYIGYETIEEMGHGHNHDNELVWIVLSVLFFGILIYIGEYLLHKKFHCDSHHDKYHKKCHDKECENIHN